MNTELCSKVLGVSIITAYVAEFIYILNGVMLEYLSTDTDLPIATTIRSARVLNDVKFMAPITIFSIIFLTCFYGIFYFSKENNYE